MQFKLVSSRHPGMMLIYIPFIFFLERERSSALDLITTTNVALNVMAHPVHFTCSCVRSCYVWCSVTPQTVTVLVHSMAVRNLLATHSPSVAIGKVSDNTYPKKHVCVTTHMDLST